MTAAAVILAGVYALIILEVSSVPIVVSSAPACRCLYLAGCTGRPHPAAELDGEGVFPRSDSCGLLGRKLEFLMNFGKAFVRNQQCLTRGHTACM